MSSGKLQPEYIGKKFTVKHCRGAIESFAKAVEGVRPAQRAKLRRWMEMQIKRLANGDRMSNDSFPFEGDLPAQTGKPKRKFRALKKIPVRGYCWKSDRYKNTFFISHYILKKKNLLDSRDTKKIGNNWSRIEVNGDEY